MRQEESFGVIPLRKRGDQWEVFLIQHARGSYWGFPKGHAEDGESSEEAAFRELKEETNLDCVRCLSKTPLKESYYFMIKGERIAKTVLYFVAEVTGNVLLQSKEIQDGAWFSLTDAKERLTHTEGKVILSQVMTLLC